MVIDWSPLKAELARCRAAGLDLPLWWRDDDAVAATDALTQLGDLSEKLGMPVHLAVIPKLAEPSLSEVCQMPSFVPMVHGWAHENHAPLLAKKAEFGNARAGLKDDAAAGLARMTALFGDDLLKVFVPPWNRTDQGLVGALAGMGYLGLSTFTPRKARLAAPALVQINTHVDPIHWRGGGGLVSGDALISQITTLLKDRREGRADATEPLGFLTHHLVHDAAIWTFTESCLQVLLDGGARPVNLRRTASALP